MNFITKRALSRRTMLRGIGASLALPMLDSMIPALNAQSVKAVPRLGFVYVSHGIIFDQWKPTKIGRDFELTPNLKPLANVRGQFNILTGLSHLEADTKGDGSGDHTRASAAWLTGVHAYDRTRPGVEVKLATTADQLAAQVMGKNLPIPSIEMTVDTPSQGACDAGDLVSQTQLMATLEPHQDEHSATQQPEDESDDACFNRQAVLGYGLDSGLLQNSGCAGR